MVAAARFLVLTEDSGQQAQSTIQTLTRAAISLVVPHVDTRRLELRPPPEKDALVTALRANGWKTKRPTPAKTRLLGEIANSLLDGFVVFHVDTDATWTSRASSQNRVAFDAIIRRGVSSVLQGHAPNPIGRRAPPMSEADASQVLRRLFVMHPCYSVESWLYQACDILAALCATAHASPDHQLLIKSWAQDRALLDELERPKDDVLGDCVADHHNAALAPAFPAREVRAAQKSWAEFVGQLANSSELLSRLMPAVRD